MIELAETKIFEILQDKEDDFRDLLKTVVIVKPLTPDEAIGDPGKWDYPLLRKKETLLQAQIENCLGQAFTGSPQDFNGTLEDVFTLDFEIISNRAIAIATINALLRKYGFIEKTVHCRNSEPEECSRIIAERLREEYGSIRIGIAGYQPAFINALVDTFGSKAVLVTDLSADNTGRNFRGVEVWDGLDRTGELISKSDLILATGSVFVNNSEDPFLLALKSGKPLYFFGTTVTGLAWLFDLPHICELGH